MDEKSGKLYRALMACLKAERVDVRVVVVTNAGLEQALGEIVKLDEGVLRQYRGLLASYLDLGDLEFGMALESFRLRQGVGVAVDPALT